MQFFPFKPFTRSARFSCFIIPFFLISFATIAQPRISGFMPLTAPMGVPITINGTGFDLITSNNIVYVGGIQARVISATATTLVVEPVAAGDYSPITITTNGLTAYSKFPFVTTFNGTSTVSSTSFAPARQFPILTGVRHSAFADFDGDGKPDLAILGDGTTSGHVLRFLRNTSSKGDISFDSTIAMSAGITTLKIAVADYDGDGKLDVALTSYLNDVNVYRNTSSIGKISFAPMQLVRAVGSIGYDIKVADCDGDGRPDILVSFGGSRIGSPAVSILRNKSTAGAISFEEPVEFAGGTPSLGDLNDDGKPELVLYNSVYENTSVPGKLAFTKVFTGRESEITAISDFDNDGRNDLLLFGENTISFYRNTGTQSIAFTPAGSKDVYRSLKHIADLNGDGKPDFITESASNQSSWTVYVNTSGTAGFSAMAGIDVASIDRVFNVMTADVDGDGKQDLVSTIGTTISVQRNVMNEPKIEAPSGLVAFNLASTFAHLAWEKPVGPIVATSYDVIVSGPFSYTTTTSLNTNFTVDSLLPDRDYRVSVVAKDAAGNRSPATNAVLIHTPRLTNGLRYRYFEGDWNVLPDFQALKHLKAGTSANLDLAIKDRSDYFGAVWEGQIRIPTTGNYTFEVLSDDGSKFYFDKLYSAQATAAIDNDSLHYASKSATLQNVSAGLHSIAISYFEKWGGETMQLFWSGPGFTRQPVPASAFSDDPGGPLANLAYSYYEGDWDLLPDFSKLVPVSAGKSKEVDVNLRRSGVNDYFGFVWNGYVKLPAAGEYTFETISDDGSKLYFGHHYTNSLEATVNNDGLHGEQNVSSTVKIAAAGTYPISMTFFEKWGGESMQVYYSGPNMPRQLIPASAFVSRPVDNIRPTIPQTLRIAEAVGNRLVLDWLNATDDQLVTGYGVYVNGVLSYVTQKPGIQISDLQPGRSYRFRVVAIDQAGNESDFSNEVVFQQSTNLYAGLNYKYYEGDWNTVPEFTQLTPVKKGVIATPALTMRNVDDYFSVLYEGKLYIPRAGDYTFELSSDDGSKFYFNKSYAPTAVPSIDNDGLHGDHIIGKTTIHVDSAGYYPFALSYFEKWGAEVLELFWSSKVIERQPIPAQYFSHDPEPSQTAFGNQSTELTREQDTWKSGQICVYPNPFTDVVHIGLSNATVNSTISADVFDVNGKRVFTQTFARQPAGNVTVSLKLTGLPKGTYHIRLNMNGTPSKLIQIVR
jgi:hypothetical protein